jgi:DNA-directed RNA polymerase subunit H (RpoH/RPB5)
LFAVDDWRINYTDPVAIHTYLAAGKVVKVEARQALEVAIEVLRP